MRRMGTVVFAVVMAGLLATAAFGQDKRFESMGIGGGGGMFSPIGSPHDPKLVFVSCDMGGFYVSEDGGKSWWMTDAYQMGGSTTCRPAFHPTDPNVVYMPYGRGQFRMSADRGKHWTMLCADGGWSQSRANAINLDRSGNGDVILVSTGVGLFRSGDGGKTFAKVADGNFIWAHFDQTTPRNARHVIAGAADGVYVSMDNGVTWAKKGAGLPETLSGFCAGSDAATGKVRCYAAAPKAAYVSDDAGLTFRKVADPPAEGDYRFACMAETQPDIAYVTATRGWGIYRTEDGGATWKPVCQFLGDNRNVTYGWLATEYGPGWGGSPGGFGVNPAHPEYAMFTNAGELFMTDNSGGRWTQAMSRHVDAGEPKRGDRWTGIGLEVTTVWRYYFDPFDTNRTYICYTDIGFTRSTDRGKTWIWSGTGSPWANTYYNLVFDPAHKGTLYASASRQHDVPGWTNVAGPTRPGGVVMSTDFGENWRPIADGLPQGNIPCTCVALDTDSDPDNRTLYAAMYGDGVYKSINGGKSWVKKSKGLGRPGNMAVYVVRIGPDKALYCLITALRRERIFDVPGGLWKSTDGGENWTELTKDLDIWYPAEFAVHPKDPNKIWVTACDVPQKNGGGVFVTTDGGKTWKQQLGNRDFDKKICDFVHVFAVDFHPTNPDIMYLSVWTHGLFRSEDGGKTWKRIEGIPCQAGTNRVTLDPEDLDTMYVTTFGKGVWRGPAKGY